jgi:Tfp pilus assembly protein PilV
MRRDNARTRGFTLVEALLAGVILALSAGVLGTSLRQSYQSVQIAAQSRQAGQVLDEILTRIDLIGPDRVSREGPTEGSVAGPAGPLNWQASIQPRLEGHLFEVTVRVSWSGQSEPGQGRRSVQAQTLLNDPPNSRDAMLNWDDLK